MVHVWKQARIGESMELDISDAKARLAELVAAARKGKRVVITTNGRPAVELMRCSRRGGIDFEKLQTARRRLGIESDGEGWPKEFNDPGFSRQVLDLDADQE